MSIRERLMEDIKQSMKARDTKRLACLRMLKARFQEMEVKLRAKEGPDYQLDDQHAEEVIATYAKQRRDSIEAFEKAGRSDRVAEEQAELAIVQEYLPQQLSAEELRELIGRAIAEAGASSAADMGAVMRIVMPQVKGRADGKQVNQIARELLS